MSMLTRIACAASLGATLLTGCQVPAYNGGGGQGGGIVHGLGAIGCVVDIRPPVAVFASYEPIDEVGRKFTVTIGVNKAKGFSIYDPEGKALVSNATSAKLEFTYGAAGGEIELNVGATSIPKYPKLGKISQSIGNFVDPYSTVITPNARETVMFTYFGAGTTFDIVAGY